MKKWEEVQIKTKEGMVKGTSPIIISASRSTDIPAFYSEWLINRLKEGYVKWVNPFNRQAQYISFDKTRVIVFWTKDVKPLISHLKEIDERKINYYFSYTMNDYEKEGYEPNIPELEQRIETFKELAEKVGKEKVVWRFDPLILTETISPEVLLDRIYKVGNQIHDYTEKLVISFADISTYRKVQNNLIRKNVKYVEFTKDSMELMAKGLFAINKDWNLEIATCSEEINLTEFDIKKNKCIDDELMIKLFNDDKVLMDFLEYDDVKESQLEMFDGVDITGPERDERNTEKRVQKQISRLKKLKDKGQRECCGCVISKDIGQYDTCNHQCIYCYANTSPKVANNNYEKYLYSTKNGESII